ncbi:MAG: serine/threonine-protein kinase [Gemmataceae bacterium]
MKTHGCPTAEVLRAFVAGGLPDGELDTVADHVDTCDACGEQVRAFEVAASPVLEALRLPPPETHVYGPGGSDHDHPPALPGYEVLGLIGAGGMGLVYKARHVKLNRTVALKCVRGGSPPEAVARFRTEAEAVARLRHPGIVQIYDIGEWSAPGQPASPYLALEYVGGGSLERHLAGPTALSSRAAAEAVEALAWAIDHAHRQGVVHRDLKPANVLVEAAGDPAQPLQVKVTDFGVAKLLAAGVDQTRDGTVLGTPSYMAPEQARGARLEVGPQADIYALGAILYHALTGRAPFLGESVLDTLAQVAHDDPVPPRRLRASVPRDLETVCLKCLLKSPRDRYATAGALADDLRRWSDGRPGTARPVPAVVRAWKWARRNAAVAASLTAAVLALSVGAGVATWQAIRADAKARALDEALEVSETRREEADKARADAELRQEESSAVLNFFRNDLLAQAGHSSQQPGPNPARGLTVREALDRAAAQVGARFRDRPMIEATLRYTIGNTYRSLQEPAKAIPHLRRAAELYAKESKPDHTETTGISLNNLGQAHLEAGQPAEAVVHLEQARDMYVRALGPVHESTVMVVNNLTIAYMRAGRWAEAVRVLEAAMDAGLRGRGPGDPEAAWMTRMLVVSLAKTGRFDRAADLLAERLGAIRAQLPKQPKVWARELSGMGELLLKGARPAKAEPLLRECLAALEKNEPDDWFTWHARSLLGLALLAQKRHADAEPIAAGRLPRPGGTEGEDRPAEPVPGDGGTGPAGRTVHRLGQAGRGLPLAGRAREGFVRPSAEPHRFLRVTASSMSLRQAASLGVISAAVRAGLSFETSTSR